MVGHMSTPSGRHALALPKGLCTRCLRALSRRLRDLSGMVWFQIDASAGLVTISGVVDPVAAEAAVNGLRWP